MLHRPRKRFGQNFLQNQAIINEILQSVHLQSHDHVVEIGPGLGALTRPLLQKLSSLTAIEIDTDLQELLLKLPEAERLTLIKGDALTVDFAQLGNHLRVIGNLPYNISTPLLIHLLHFLPVITDMHFMLQKEVVDRLVATPGSKAYGRLSVIVQYYCDVEHVVDVPPEAFFPIPKVVSAVVRLTPLRPSPYPTINMANLEQLIACAFSMRRKTLANNLKPLITSQELIALDIEPTLRPEQINIRQYVQIAKFIFK